jgi:YVTN family beta-propeller protein
MNNTGTSGISIHRDGRRCRPWPFVTTLFVAASALLPTCFAAQQGHDIYVTNELSGDLTIIDGQTLQVSATVPLGKRPRGIEATRDGSQLFIALSGSPIQGPPGARTESSMDAVADKTADGIGLFDVAKRGLSRVIRGVSDPEKMAVSADGKRLYVASEDTGAVIVIDVASGNVAATVPVGAEPEGVRISPDGRIVVVTAEAAQQAAVIDTRSNRVVARLKVGQRPRAIVFTPDGTRAFVPGEIDSTVTVIDVLKLAVVATIRIDDPAARPMDALVSPDGRSLYLSTGRGGTVIQIDARSNKVLRTVKVGTRPWGLAMSPDGARIYVANGPSDDMSVIDADSFKVISTVKTGNGPWGIAVSAWQSAR